MRADAATMRQAVAEVVELRGRAEQSTPICCPNCRRVLARRYATFTLIAYHGRTYSVGELREIICRCGAKVCLPTIQPIDIAPNLGID